MRNLSNDMMTQAVLWSQLAHASVDSGTRAMCYALASAHMEAYDRTYIDVAHVEVPKVEITESDRAWFARPIG